MLIPSLSPHRRDLPARAETRQTGWGPAEQRCLFFWDNLTSKRVRSTARCLKKKRGPFAELIKGDIDPVGFLQMVYIDPQGFDRQHYDFVYIGREFLGEVRCLAFDITPLPKSGKSRFEGRIWVEDSGYTIVRFDGVYKPIHSNGFNGGTNVHFDSWRLNVQPDLWLPSLIFSEDLNLKRASRNTSIRFKSQTRLWGYLTRDDRQSEFSSITIDSAQDEAEAEQRDRSPLEAEREWQHQAEIERD